jgi:hypothetical protein
MRPRQRSTRRGPRWRYSGGIGPASRLLSNPS